MTAQRAAPEASSMLQDLMTAHQSASGQISHAPEDQPTTARKKRAGQTDLLITTHLVQILEAQIQEASVSQHLVLTALGNHALQELIDHREQEATTALNVHRIVQHDQTLTVLGNLVHQELTDLHLTATIQIDHQEQEATTVQIVLQDLTQIVRGNHAPQELIAQSAQATHVDLRLVQTLASLTATATRSARTAYHAIAQEMKHLLALATRTQTRRLSSRTRF
jgi:hypothetical protein